MKRSLLLSLMLVVSAFCYAQVPPYYFNAISSLNNKPDGFNTTNTKFQALYVPGIINTPSVAPSGAITSIWFKAGTATTNATYTNFSIKLGWQTGTTFSSATYVTTNMTPVLSAASFTIPATAAGSWIEIPLTGPYFTYDNTKSLIVEVSQTASTNGFDLMTTLNLPNRRIYGSTSSSTGTLETTGFIPAVGLTIKVPCPAPTNIQKTNITTTSATISWSYPYTNAWGWEQVLDQSSSDPTSTGYDTTLNPITYTGLTPGTCYYVHFRTNCITGSLDTVSTSWALDSFCTLPSCDPPPVTIDPLKVMGTTAIAEWDPVLGVSKYEYAVSIDTIPPTKGTFTTYTKVELKGLKPNQPYWFFLRSYCSPVPVSDWEKIPFHTTPASVSELEGNGFALEAFPNPVQRTVAVRIDGERSGIGQLTITSLTGQVMYTGTVNTERVDIDMSSMAAGMYIMRYTDGQHSSVLKLTKE